MSKESDANIVKCDVLIVGGGPSGLSTAIHLANMLNEQGIKKRVLVIDKGESIGSHILSGAVIKPDIFRELLPYTDFNEIPFDTDVLEDSTLFLTQNDYYTLPFHPPYMNNKGNKIASLAHLCNWLSKVAEKKGVEVYSGFSADEVLYDDEDRVIGVKTKDTGIDSDGTKLPNFQEGSKVLASVTVFAEGTRGSLTKKLIKKFDLDAGKNPQIYSLGVKELWRVKEGKIKSGTVYHTAGYPLKDGEEFGGGFIYGLSENRVAVGLVVGLDYKDPTFDIHGAFQVWKQHPFVKEILEGGEILEYGAKTLPEGGYNSIIKFYGDGFMIVGDSAGFLATASLKGVHLSVASGILSAKTAYKALKEEDFTQNTLKEYDELFKDSILYRELYPVRNFRQSFSNGMISGALRFGVQLITNGSCLTGDLKSEPDSETLRSILDESRPSFKERFKDKLEFDKVLTFDKVTDVFYSGAIHDEHQPSHLLVDDERVRQNIKEYGGACQYFCPAEVYEVRGEELRVHAENCVHCKTCDIKAPKEAIVWDTPYGGDGPKYRYM
jgi:electron-transferring-flavoprotein dehydrogenase